MTGRDARIPMRHGDERGTLRCGHFVCIPSGDQPYLLINDGGERPRRETLGPCCHEALRLDAGRLA